MTRVEGVEKFLLDGIASGRFKIGEKLPGEEALALVVDASRLTLREAVKSLAAQQILTSVHGRGTFVNDPSKWLSPSAVMQVQQGNFRDLMLNLIEVRGFLEVGAVENFTRNASPDQIAELTAHLNEMIAAHERSDVEAVVQADLDFHEVIIQGCGNPFIPTAMAPLSKALVDARVATSNIPEMRIHAIAEHASIIEAIQSGDSDAARDAMRSHMHQTTEDARHFFSDND